MIWVIRVARDPLNKNIYKYKWLIELKELSLKELSLKELSLKELSLKELGGIERNVELRGQKI